MLLLLAWMALHRRSCQLCSRRPLYCTRPGRARRNHRLARPVEITHASWMPPPRALLHCGSLAQLKRLKPLYLMLRSRAVYLVDFACFRTKPNCRVPFATFLEHSRVWPGFDKRSVRFMTWLLERSGLGEET